MKENLRESFLETQKEFKVELELNVPKVEVLGNIAEFTRAKSNRLESRVYMLV